MVSSRWFWNGLWQKDQCGVVFDKRASVTCHCDLAFDKRACLEWFFTQSKGKLKQIDLWQKGHCSWVFHKRAFFFTARIFSISGIWLHNEDLFKNEHTFWDYMLQKKCLLLLFLVLILTWDLHAFFIDFFIDLEGWKINTLYWKTMLINIFLLILITINIRYPGCSETQISFALGQPSR